MNNKKISNGVKDKIFKLLILWGIIFPQALWAQTVDWNIGVGGDGWGVQVGSGNSSGFGSMGGLGLPGGSIYGIIANILYWLLAIIGIVAVIGFVISGILYLTAAGNETQAEKAKRAMLYSIIGVIVGLSGFVVLQAATYMLSGVFF